MTWDGIIAINQSLCEAHKLDLLKGKKYDKAKSVWEKGHTQKRTLQEAIELCRQCNEMVPFTFNSGNTFAKICQGLVEEWSPGMPALESLILRTTVAHYVNGQVSKAELNSILKMAEKYVGQDHSPIRSVPPVIVSTPSASQKQQELPV